MTVPTFKIGDKVRVLRVPPSVELEMPAETVELFRRCVGQAFCIDGFDEYGHLKLSIADNVSQVPVFSKDTIWIEPEFVESVL